MTKITRTIRMATVTVLSLNEDKLESRTFNLPYSNKKVLTKEAREELARMFPSDEFVKVSVIHYIFDAVVEMPLVDFLTYGNIASTKEVNALEA